MESTVIDTAAPASTDQAAAIPSFAEQMQAAKAAPAASTAAQAPPVQAAAPAENGNAAAATAAPDPTAPPAWLKELGTDFNTVDELKLLLGKVPALQTNQITDEQKASLRLISEPEARREYLRLLDTDYTAMDDEAVLREEFKAQYPTMDEAARERNFQRSLDNKFPGLANDPTDPDYQADAAMRKAEADKARTRFTTDKDAKLGEFQQGALKQAGPSAEEVQQQRDAHLDQVKTLVSQGADGFKLTVNVNGTPLNLAVEAADLPAIEAVMQNPYAALANEDGTPNYLAIKEYATIKALFPKLLGLAQKAALEGQGAVVRVGELHNGEEGHNPNQRPAQGASFVEQLAAATGGAKASLRY